MAWCSAEDPASGQRCGSSRGNRCRSARAAVEFGPAGKVKITGAFSLSWITVRPSRRSKIPTSDRRLTPHQSDENDGDPFDALIVSVARDLRLPLVTRDAEIRQSGVVKIIW
jgi:hypothetical protein